MKKLFFLFLISVLFLSNCELFNLIEGNNDPPTPSAPKIIIPTTPSNFVMHCNRVTLGSEYAWGEFNDVVNETGYRIERSDDNATYSFLSTLPADSTVFSDTSVIAGETWYYRVIAFNNDGESTPTTGISIYIEPADIPDTTPPIITLVGENPQEIILNDTYSELGATALDDVDGDISNRIIIDSSNIDILTIGDYYVYYNVDDNAGNHAIEVERLVEVVAPIPSSPENFSVLPTNVDEVLFTWDTTINATSYVIEASIHQVEDQAWGYNDETWIATLAENEDEYTYSNPIDFNNYFGIYPNHVYHFRIKAVNNYGESDWAYIWNFHTPKELSGYAFFTDEGQDNVLDGYSNGPEIILNYQLENFIILRARSGSLSGPIIDETILNETISMPESDTVDYSIDDDNLTISADGTRTLFLEIEDEFGNILQFSPSIIVDTEPPANTYSTVSLQGNQLTMNHYEWEADEVIEIKVDYWFYSEDPDNAGGMVFVFSRTIDWFEMEDIHTITTANYLRECILTYRDAAGNTSTQTFEDF